LASLSGDPDVLDTVSTVPACTLHRLFGLARFIVPVEPPKEPGGDATRALSRRAFSGASTAKPRRHQRLIGYDSHSAGSSSVAESAARRNSTPAAVVSTPLAFMDFCATVATGAAARTVTEAAERADMI